MASTVQRRRGQGVDVTLEQIAAERARVRLANALRGIMSDFMVVWSPEETEALRETLKGKGVRAA